MVLTSSQSRARAKAFPKDHWAAAECFEDGQALRAWVHRDYAIGLHTHDFIELNVVIQGHARHTLREQAWPVSRGDVFVILPGMEHGYDQSRALDVYHVLLHPDFVARQELRLQRVPGYLLLFSVEPFFRPGVGFRHALQLGPEQLSTAEALLDTLAVEGRGGWAQGNLAAESLGLYLLAKLCAWHREQHGTAAAEGSPLQSIAAALERVERSYAERLSLDDLARAAHLERSYFCRLFRDAVGLTPMAYLKQVRLRVAESLLRESRRPVSQIALAVGFYDSAHFSRAFSARYGMPPSQYRKAAWRTGGRNGTTGEAHPEGRQGTTAQDER